MRIILEFRCPEHDVFEKLTDSVIQHEACPKCGSASNRIISTPRIRLDGTDPGFPDAYDAWEKKRSAKQVIEEKLIREHGSIT